MTSEPRYLAPHTLAEPLVDHWPAWWMTVAPLPAAVHARRYQIPLLQGYLQSPDFHARAGKDRKMSGGPFIAVDPQRLEEVRQLLQRSLQERKGALAFAEGYEQFEQLVVREGKGGSLQGLYARAPEALRGTFELVYDYLNRPSIRFFEPLTYRTEAYQPKLQSLELSTLAVDWRTSWLSTPRLSEPGALTLPFPFADERLDALYRLDRAPARLDELQSLLGLPDSAKGVLESLTTPDAPRPFERWGGPGMRLSYLGHATLLAEWAGTTVLVDPVVSPTPREPAMQRWSFRDLPERIDYVIITHAHADHFSLETLLRLRHRLGTLVVPRASGALVGDVSLAELARKLGFRSVVELGAMESIALSREAEIVSVPFLGEHGDLAHAKSAYVLRDRDHRVLLAADSAAIDPALYTRVRDALGPIQTAFLNTETEGSPLAFSIEALLPRERNRLVERDRRCRGSTAAEALQMLERIGARRVFNYAMGLEPWLEYITGYVDPASNRMKDSDALLLAAREKGLLAERLERPKQMVFADAAG